MKTIESKYHELTYNILKLLKEKTLLCGDIYQQGKLLYSGCFFSLEDSEDNSLMIIDEHKSNILIEAHVNSLTFVYLKSNTDTIVDEYLKKGYLYNELVKNVNKEMESILFDKLESRKKELELEKYRNLLDNHLNEFEKKV